MPNPIRCFNGNAKPYEAFWHFRNGADTQTGETELELYGPISEFSWFGDEITPKLFREQLKAQGNKPITVRMDSPGGDLIAASVIRAALIDYPGRITVKVDGLAASAAVMVALAGDVIKMQVSAYMMIHDPMVGLLGYFNVDELKSLIDELKVIKDGIVDGYAAKTTMEKEQIAKMMLNEGTWMTASEAVAYGFADEVITGPEKLQAKMANYVNVLQSTYVNIPPAVLTSLQRRTDETERKAQRLAAQARQFITRSNP